MRIGDIRLGSIDAKNQLIGSTPDESHRFVNSFVKPPSLDVERYKNRQKYYIVGAKGTGKTALLRYVSIELETDAVKSYFTLFKTDIDEPDKAHLARASRVNVALENSESSEIDDFEPVWRWFIYRKICDIIFESKCNLFEANANYSHFVDTVSSADDADSFGGAIRSLIPRIKKGIIEISRKPKINIELSWDSNGKAKVPFSDLVKRADKAFSELSPGREGVNLFFDELELNYATSKQHKRDTILVRDLVATIDRLNALSKKKCFNICMYAAIRSEVLSSIASTGKEINKSIGDFGAEIVWNRAGLDSSQQPLLGIIEKWINVYMEEAGESLLTSDQIWGRFFPDLILGKKAQNYILHNSWYRPRDIVRLLGAIQDQYPDEKTFGVGCFESIRKKYSSESWIEITEELKAKYKSEEIESIKNILYGYKQIFSVKDFDDRVDECGNHFPDVKKMSKTRSNREILKDLFRVGVIGNIEPGTGRENRAMRFSFRGDDDILFTKNMFIHNALRSKLSLD